MERRKRPSRAPPNTLANAMPPIATGLIRHLLRDCSRNARRAERCTTRSSPRVSGGVLVGHDTGRSRPRGIRRPSGELTDLLGVLVVDGLYVLELDRHAGDLAGELERGL